jgi:tetratricopeptide (TPR) repeat protein
VARCEQLLEQTELGGRAHVLTFLAGLQALEGKFQPARGLIAEAGEIYEQLGWTRPYATGYGTIAAEIESLAGEPAAAEALLRAACETLERMGERVHGSTQAAQLADVLYELGAYDEAERWASLSEANSPPGDVSAQCSWRPVRAKLMTRRGELDAARTLAEEAVALAEPTDTLNRKGTLRLDLAEVLRLGGAPSTATPLIDEAMRLFEAKGSTVLVDRARARSEALLVR